MPVRPTISREKALAELHAAVKQFTRSRPGPNASAVALQKLLLLTASQETSVREMAAVVRADPALAGRLLQLTNAASLVTHVKAKSIEEAIKRIGTNSLHALCRKLLSVQLVSFSDMTRGISKGCFCQHGLAVAGFAGRLSKTLGGGSADTMYTFGLLHDIGIPLLMDIFGEDYCEVLERCLSDATDLPNLELERFGVDHADAGAELLKEWGLGDPLVQLAAHHHRSSPGRSGTRKAMVEDLELFLVAESLADVAGSSLIPRADERIDRWYTVPPRFRARSMLEPVYRENRRESSLDAALLRGLGLELPPAVEVKKPRHRVTIVNGAPGELTWLEALVLPETFEVEVVRADWSQLPTVEHRSLVLIPENEVVYWEWCAKLVDMSPGTFLYRPAGAAAAGIGRGVAEPPASSILDGNMTRAEVIAALSSGERGREGVEVGANS